MKCLKFFLLTCIANCCFGISSNAYNGPINLPLHKEMGTTSSLHPMENRFVGGGVPDSILHGLRVFDWLLTCDSSWANLTHHDGASGAYDLTTATCSVFTELPPYHQNTFKIFDYAMFPTLALLDRGDAHEQAFDMMVSKVENEYNAQYYLLVGMQINPEDNSVVYKVELHLPRDSSFTGMNSTLENMFEAQILAAAENYHNENPAFAELGNSERAAISELQWLLYQFFHGSYNDLNEETLINNGFFPMPYDATGIERMGVDTTFGNVRDFAGLKFGTMLLAEDGNSIISSMTSSPSLRVFYTDNQNYSSGSNNAFETASQLFEDATQKVILWFHLSVTPNDTTMYFKSRNNFTPEEADGIMQAAYTSYMDFLESGGTSAIIGDNQDEKSMICPEWEFDLSWNTKGDGGNYLYNCIENQVTGLNAYFGGIACGVLDGALSSINMLSDIGKAFFDLYKYAPNTGVSQLDGVSYFAATTDIFFKSFQKEAAEKAWYKGWSFDLDSGIKEHYKDKNAYWAKMFSIYQAVCTEGYLRGMLNNLLDQFKTMFGDALGFNGAKPAGYSHGQIIFEILMAIVSGGGANAVKEIGTLAKQNIQELWGALEKGAFKDFMGSKWDGIKNTAKGVKCKLFGGCFVKGTPVMIATAMGITTAPIDSLNIFDYVVANTAVNQSYNATASTENVYYGNADPYISEQQVERDGYELDNENWFEVSFQSLQGKGYCKLGLHKEWMAEHGIDGVGSVVSLILPEQRMSGSFVVTSLIQKIPEEAPIDENPLDDFVFQPITGIFVHDSNEVWMLKFDNGDSLGVTNNHPLFSATFNDWRLAGKLMPGEKILTRYGQNLVVSKIVLPGIRQVFNLEVKNCHNFLVGNEGYLVHNSCIIYELLEDIKDAVEFDDLRNSLLNNYDVIPADWVRQVTPSGTRYVNPNNADDFFRLQREGVSAGTHNFGKPYYRRASGKYSNGSPKYLDLNGNVSADYFETHIVIEEIAKLTN